MFIKSMFYKYSKSIILYELIIEDITKEIEILNEKVLDYCAFFSCLTTDNHFFFVEFVIVLIYL